MSVLDRGTHALSWSVKTLSGSVKATKIYGLSFHAFANFGSMFSVRKLVSVDTVQTFPSSEVIVPTELTRSFEPQ